MSWFMKKGCQISRKWIRQITLLFFVLSVVSCGFKMPWYPSSDSSSEQEGSSASEQNSSLPTENSANNQQEADDKTRVPNPAAVKCSDDGYESRPVNNEFGVPSYSMCYNPQTGKQCEEWAYYRGECRLT